VYVATCNSGLTSVARVTMPLTQTSLPMLLAFTSRMGMCFSCPDALKYTSLCIQNKQAVCSFLHTPTTRHCPQLLQQSINISGLLGPQQQTCSSGWTGRRQKDVRQLHKQYYTDSANNWDDNTHTFNGPLSGTTRVSRYQKGKPIWILLKQETVSGGGVSWAICKSAPRSR